MNIPYTSTDKIFTSRRGCAAAGSLCVRTSETFLRCTAVGGHYRDVYCDSYSSKVGLGTRAIGTGGATNRGGADDAGDAGGRRAASSPSALSYCALPSSVEEETWLAGLYVALALARGLWRSLSQSLLRGTLSCSAEHMLIVTLSAAAAAEAVTSTPDRGTGTTNSRPR
eukprot:SAG31_NODE_3733_length_3940_cov_2.160115_7_plen_169_part_00